MIRPRAVRALFRANLRTAMSYRVRFLQSIAFSFITVVPVFFVARALQGMMAETIQQEGGDYFAFLIVGFVVLSIITACVDVLPSAVGGDINNGFFEALLVAPAGAPSVLVGMVSYPLAFATVRGAMMLAVSTLLGVQLAVERLPAILLIVFLLVVSHVGISLIATAAVVAFRTNLSIPQFVLMASSFLGGVYWPTYVLPAWVRDVSEVLPLSYGLRALRHAGLSGRPLAEVSGDVATLAAFGGFLLAVGAILMSLSLAHARRRGTLSQY